MEDVKLDLLKKEEDRMHPAQLAYYLTIHGNKTTDLRWKYFSIMFIYLKEEKILKTIKE